MPAPTVSFVDSSMRMKLPVARLRRYSSTSSGAESQQAQLADLVQLESVGVLVARCEFTSMR